MTPRVLNKYAVFTALLILVLITTQSSLADDRISVFKNWNPFDLQKKKFEKYGIVTAGTEDYPVTIFENGDLPPSESGDDILWLDNETLLYVEKMPLSSGETYKEYSHPLISVNIKTFEKKIVARVTSTKVCFDYKTKNIHYLSFKNSGAQKEYIHSYGKFGGDLKEFIEDDKPKSIFEQPYINPLDCTFYEVSPPWRKDWRALRHGDGIVSIKSQGDGQVTSYIFKNAKNVEKIISFGASNTPSFNYDDFSGHYWQSETLLDKSVYVWRFDADLNLVAEEAYPVGPWAVGSPISIFKHSVKAGFLVGGRMGDSKQPREMTYLVTKDKQIIHLPRVMGIRAISPDGCRAIGGFYLNEGKDVETPATVRRAVVDLCHRERDRNY